MALRRACPYRNSVEEAFRPEEIPSSGPSVEGQAQRPDERINRVIAALSRRLFTRTYARLSALRIGCSTH